MPRIKIPILNPISPVDKNRALLPGYHTKQFDAWFDYEQILPYQQRISQFQKVQRGDLMKLQIVSDFSPVVAQVRDHTGLVVLSQVMNAVATIGSDTYYQSSIATDTPPFAGDGCYILEFVGGSPALIVLECLCWHVQDEWNETILVSYSNKFNNHVLWEYLNEMSLRISAAIVYEAPASKRTTYIDQPGAGQTVKGDSARIFKLYVGIDGGEWNSNIDRLDEILNQTDVFFDGKGFSPVPGAAWNPKKSERYPKSQWNIDMRETTNRREKIFEANGLQEAKVVQDIFATSKLFGPISGNPASDNSYTITTVK